MSRLFHPSICSIKLDIEKQCPCAVYAKGALRCTSGFRSTALDVRGWYSLESSRLLIGAGDGPPEDAYDYESVIIRPDICKETLGSHPKYLAQEEKEALLKQLHWLWLALLHEDDELYWIAKTAEIARLSTNKNSTKEQWPLVLIPITKHSTLRVFTSEIDTLFDNASPLFWDIGPLDFLRAHNIEYVVATINSDDFCLSEQHGIPISRLVFKAPAIVGKAFTHFVANYGGCFTVATGDAYQEEWCVLESM